MVLMAGMTAVAPRAAGPIALEDMNRGAGVGHMRRHGAAQLTDTDQANGNFGHGGYSLPSDGRYGSIVAPAEPRGPVSCAAARFGGGFVSCAAADVGGGTWGIRRNNHPLRAS